MRSKLTKMFTSTILAFATLVLAGCIEPDKPVLPRQYSNDLDLNLGNYSICMADPDKQTASEWTIGEMIINN